MSPWVHESMSPKKLADSHEPADEEIVNIKLRFIIELKYMVFISITRNMLDNYIAICTLQKS